VLLAAHAAQEGDTVAGDFDGDATVNLLRQNTPRTKRVNG